MNMQKVFKVIKKGKVARICNKVIIDAATGETINNAQWLSNFHAAYRIEKIPQLDTSALLEILGKNPDKFLCTQIEDMEYCLDDSHESDIKLDYARLTINKYSLYYAATKPVFIDPDLIAPLAIVDLYLREGGYVVAKESGIVKAIISPQPLICEDFSEEIDLLSDTMRGVLHG